MDLLSVNDFDGHLTHNKYYINNQQLCFYTWCLVYDFHFGMAYKAQTSLQQGYWFSIVQPKHVADAILRINVEKFLIEHFDLLAHWDPTGRKATIQNFNRKDFWNRVYVKDCIDKKIPYASYVYFMKIWKTSFSHVRMTDKQRFSICQICQDFNREIRNVCNL
jgi:hypothetical protein